MHKKQNNKIIISSKFNIGEQVEHKLLGLTGVIIDIDPKYSLNNSSNAKKINKSLKKKPWYHIIIEDHNGYPMHIYLSETQLSWKIKEEYSEKTSLDKLSKIIKKQIKNNKTDN